MVNISVIIPVYNAVKTLRRCVDSVLSQNCKDIEVILIDDGSTDGSVQICDEIKEQRGNVIVIHKKNEGVSSARNEGIRVASGKWISFIDSDDYIEQNYFPVSFDERVDVYVQNFECFGVSNWRHNRYVNRQYCGEELSDFLKRNMQDLVFIAPWSKIYKAGIIKNNSLLFDTRYRCGEDCLFNMKYYNYVGCLQILDTGRYMYYRNESSRQEYARKYGLTIEYAITYVTELWKLYKASKFKNKILLETEMSGYLYNSSLVSTTPLRDKILWYTNGSVYEVLHELGYCDGLKGRIRKILSTLFSKHE